MKWKNLPSWIKGGLIFVLVETVLISLTLLSELKDGSMWDWLLLMTQYPFAFGAMFMGGTKDVIIGFIEQYALYFLVGALFGWLNEKLKSKKTDSIPI